MRKIALHESNHLVSESFSGMIFSSRFKLLNQILKEQQSDLFSKHIYVFEAFTSGEVKQLTIAQSDDNEESNSEKYKNSAKEL